MGVCSFGRAKPPPATLTSRANGSAAVLWGMPVPPARAPSRPPAIAAPVALQPGARRCRPRASQLLSDVHQGEAQQVDATPARRHSRILVRRPESDAPDSVPRARLNENPDSGLDQEEPQIDVLPELRHVAGDDEVEASGLP